MRRAENVFASEMADGRRPGAGAGRGPVLPPRRRTSTCSFPCRSKARSRRNDPIVKGFNETHPDIEATPVFTGSYDETLIKTRAATEAGKPPSVIIMSANFLTT